MADSYLSIAAIAGDEYMTERLNACTTQQHYLGTIDLGDSWGSSPGAPLSWVVNNRYVWASSPGWGAAWESALAGDPDAEPGKDPAVITDDMILAAVQTLAAPDRGRGDSQAE
jgi:hypothetical protein